MRCPPRSRLAVLSLAVGLASLAATSLPAEEESTLGSGELAVTVFGAEGSEGEVMLALYGDAESFDEGGEPIRSERLEPQPELVWRIDGVEYGWYAVKAYHDLDGDGELDRGTLGRPTEPYGFSNDARGRFGPPSFEAARFEHRSESTEISLELR